MGETVYDEKTAYHEAGHAVIDCVVGLTVRSVTIVPNGKVAGKTCVAEEGIPPEWDTYSDRSAGKKKYIRRYTLAKLAGYAAVQKRFPDHEREEADRRDEVSARRFIDKISWEDQEQYLEARRVEVRELVSGHWRWIENVANALLKEGTLSGDKVREFRPPA